MNFPKAVRGEKPADSFFFFRAGIGGRFIPSKFPSTANSFFRGSDYIAKDLAPGEFPRGESPLQAVTFSWLV